MEGMRGREGMRIYIKHTKHKDRYVVKELIRNVTEPNENFQPIQQFMALLKPICWALIFIPFIAMFDVWQREWRICKRLGINL